MWKILHSGKKSADENMKFDKKLFEELQPDHSPILHLYGWERPSATYGYFIDPSKIFRSTKSLDISRRPTGGGVLFHIWDLAFSVLIPKNHHGYSQDIMKNYKFVNDAVLIAIKEYIASPIHLLPEEMHPLDHHSKNFCFAKPTKYDVMIGGKKVAGAAQRRKRNGFLHQGSISLALPNYEFLSEVLPTENRVIEAMKMHTYAPLGESVTDADIESARHDLSRYLEKTFSQL